MNRNDHNPALRDDLALGTAIGLLELGSVARGVEVADAILFLAGDGAKAMNGQVMTLDGGELLS